MAEHDLLPRSLRPDSRGVVVETRDGVILRVAKHARAAQRACEQGRRTFCPCWARASCSPRCKLNDPPPDSHR